MCPSHFYRVRFESESNAFPVRAESELSKIFSSQSRVMTGSSRVRVESQELSLQVIGLQARVKVESQ